MKTLAVTVAALVAVVVLVLTYREEPRPMVQARDAKKTRDANAPSSPSVVLSINAAKASPVPAAAIDIVSPMAREYEKARNLKPLYDRLKAGGANTPEGKYFLYKILARCASRSDRAPSSSPPRTTADRRKELEAQIPMTSKDRDKRLAAFDQVNATERCAGLEGLTTTKADLELLLKEAADAGDPKARALMTTNEVMASSKPIAPGTSPANSGGPGITDAQYQALRDAIASRDPEAILIAGTTFSNTFRDAVVEVGPDHEELQNRASMEAWRLVACEFGADCGPNSAALQVACAYGGQCAATTVPDQIYYYGVSPYEAQLIDQYRQLFHNAATNNDWSGIDLSRRPNNSSSRYMFNNTP